MFLKLKSLPLLAFVLLLSPYPAFAGEGRVDQAEGLEIEKDAFELEFQTIFVPESNGEEGEWKIAPTIEYGVSEALSVGLEIEFEKEAGEALQLSEVGVQAKLVVISPENAAVGLGIQSAVIFDRSSDVGFETYFIAEHKSDQIDVIANLVLSAEPGDWSELSTSYVGRFDHAIGNHFSLGLEAGGEISGEAKGRHWLGPVLSAAGEEGSPIPAFELSIFAPLTHRTPDIQFRLELDWEF
ncbi:hypothetical protein [Sphingorhabdus sp. M41]|uniref:hypothetical protein n=1 Tax=Sphingorhabdus sp. M41 TaxID=1806885 RepID=UPI00078E15C8|nr:hypothetical protein [Sphingorhabdus sp. M41]AMO72717.1 hypothetical protein AZE99_13435 [Sphingorhabdus sp. M41]